MRPASTTTLTMGWWLDRRLRRELSSMAGSQQKADWVEAALTIVGSVERGEVTIVWRTCVGALLRPIAGSGPSLSGSMLEAGRVEDETRYQTTTATAVEDDGRWPTSARTTRSCGRRTVSPFRPRHTGGGSQSTPCRATPRPVRRRRLSRGRRGQGLCCACETGVRSSASATGPATGPRWRRRERNPGPKPRGQLPLHTRAFGLLILTSIARDRRSARIE